MLSAIINVAKQHVIPNQLHQPSPVGRKRQKGSEQRISAENTWYGDEGQKQPLVTLGTSPSRCPHRGSEGRAKDWLWLCLSQVQHHREGQGWPSC